jgi:predicted RNA-binding Zn-ribbon protein involved in translation (DUF1610 family)
MGSVHTAFCDCGFAADVTVGGTRQNFLENSAFPFLCNGCGLVSVNIAKLARDVYVTNCPQCGAEGCTQYGTPPASLHDLRPKPWWRRMMGEKQLEMSSSKVIMWGKRQAALTEHHCPACGQMTLEFSRYPDLMFD